MGRGRRKALAASRMTCRRRKRRGREKERKGGGGGGGRDLLVVLLIVARVVMVVGARAGCSSGSLCVCRMYMYAAECLLSHQACALPGWLDGDLGLLG